MKLPLTCCLLLCVGLLACYEEARVSPTDVIRSFNPTNASIPADGVSTTVLEVELPAETPPDRRTVSFTATKGIFEESGKPEATVKAVYKSSGVSERLVASVHLQSLAIVSQSKVTARIADVEATTLVSFVRAYPSTLAMRTDKLALKTGFDSEATVTVLLRRAQGIVSPGTVVRLELLDTLAAPKSRGFVRPSSNESNDKGESAFVITMGSDAYVGRLIAKATVYDSTLKTTATEQINLFALKP